MILSLDSLSKAGILLAYLSISMILNSLTKKLLIKPHMYSVTGVRPVPAELHLMQVYMPYFVFRNPKDPFVRNVPTETYIGFSLLRIQGTGY